MSVFSPDALAGKVVLLTGASRGIGRATAISLSEAGARLIISGRDAEALKELARQLGDSCLAILTADLAQPGAAKDLAGQAIALAEIDILINCAGVSVSEPPGVLTDDVDRMLEINVRSPLVLSGLLAPKMAARGGGVIVNVSSIAALQGIAGVPAYSASKGAVDAMTRALSLQYGPAHVRVNSVAPGFVRTDFSKGADKVPGVLDAVARGTAIREVAEAEDIAEVIVFLASPAARFVSGQVLAVDGGFTTTKELIPKELFAAKGKSR